jgi:hypothetical protein
MKIYPSHAAVASVLRKLGIPPETRFDSSDQDAQYTACRSEEIGDYHRLYSAESTTIEERDALCCFMLQSLNDLVQSGIRHPLETQVLAMLLADERHRDECEYWSDTEDPNDQNWWPITKVILALKG